MKAYNTAQRIVSIVFLLSLFTYLILNIRLQQYDIIYGLSIVAPNSTLAEYAEKTQEIEDILSEYTYQRQFLIDTYAYIQLGLGKEENGNFDIVRTKDGSLNYGDFYHDIPRMLEEYALRVRKLKDYAGGYGCEVIFINTPPINVDGYHTYSDGLHFQNQDVFMDAMLFYLQGFGVDCLDMRTALKNSGLDLSRYRYKTDSHWTIEASFEGFRALVSTLEDDFGENLDPDGFYTDIGNYTSTLYPDGMSGTLGARAGLPFAGREDFTMLLPGFPTSYTHEHDEEGVMRRAEGDFTEAIIDSDYLSSDNLYLSYLGGVAPFRSVVNNDNPDGLRVLFLSDSYSLPLASFLSTCVSRVDMIYTLSQEVFGYFVDIDAYVAENAENYDYIFVELSPGCFSDGGFSFFRD